MAVEGREEGAEEYRPPPWPEDFGERLERLMAMAGLSRQDLARLFGVTERTVQKWLGGGKPSGGSYWGIMTLARRIPGGFELMLYGDAGPVGGTEE